MRTKVVLEIPDALEPAAADRKWQAAHKFPVLDRWDVTMDIDSMEPREKEAALSRQERLDDNPYKSPQSLGDTGPTMPGLAKCLGYIGILASVCYIVGFSAWLGLTSLLSWFSR